LALLYKAQGRYHAMGRAANVLPFSASWSYYLGNLGFNSRIGFQSRAHAG
jgi:hypothetical protein